MNVSNKWLQNFGRLFSSWVHQRPVHIHELMKRSVYSYNIFSDKNKMRNKSKENYKINCDEEILYIQCHIKQEMVLKSIA